MARPRQVSDEEILDAARRCFLEHGASVSTTVIAEQIGVSQAALFKRFGTKQDLLVAALLPPEVPRWIERVERGPDDRPIPDQLQEIAATISSFFEEMLPRMAILKLSGCKFEDIFDRFEVPPPIRGRAALREWLATAQGQGRVGPCDPSAVSLMLLGAIQGHAFMRRIFGLADLEDIDRYVAQFVSTLWRGIAPPEDP